LEGFASWLESACPFSVVIVQERMRLQPGKVYLANRDRHLRVLRGYVQVDGGDPVCARGRLERSSSSLLQTAMDGRQWGCYSREWERMEHKGSYDFATRAATRLQSMGPPRLCMECRQRQSGWAACVNRRLFQRSLPGFSI